MEKSYRNYPSIFFTVSIVINIITCFVVWYYKSKVGPVAPLHYNVVSGFDEIGSTINIYGLPAFAFAIAILNFFISRSFSKLGTYIAVLINLTSLAVGLVLLFSALFLLRVGG